MVKSNMPPELAAMLLGLSAAVGPSIGKIEGKNLETGQVKEYNSIDDLLKDIEAQMMRGTQKPAEGIIKGKKEITLQLDGEGTGQSFLSKLSDELAKATAMAAKDGIPTVGLCIHGEILVDKSLQTALANQAKPPKRVPSAHQIFWAMMAGKFKPMSDNDLQAWQGVEGDAWQAEIDGDLVVIDLQEDGIFINIAMEDGRLYACDQCELFNDMDLDLTGSVGSAI